MIINKPDVKRLQKKCRNLKNSSGVLTTKSFILGVLAGTINEMSSFKLFKTRIPRRAVSHLPPGGRGGGGTGATSTSAMGKVLV